MPQVARDHEKIVGLAIASGFVGGDHGAVNKSEPPGFLEVVGGAVPVAPDDPWALSEVEERCGAMEQVGVGFGSRADHVVEVDRSEVEASAHDCSEFAE
jgi:hypothetical protein